MKLTALLLAGFSLCAQTRTPVTHQKVWMMKRVGAPAASPDGRWVAASVVEPSYDPAEQVSDLWLFSTDGKTPPRRLTSNKVPESGVSWSPDSRRIAFATKREGDDVPQIYILPVIDGGEAWRLTKLATGASSPLWRPDGQAILFQSDVYDGANSEEENARSLADRKAHKYTAKSWDSYPIARWDKWVEDRHPHPMVQAISADAKPVDLLAHTKLAAEPGFAANSTPDGGEDLEPAWSGDGHWVVFVASTDRNQIVVTQPSVHLYRVAASGGEPQAVTSGPDHYESPQFSPDGKTLYAKHTRGGNQVLYSHSRIARFAWPPAGRAELLAPGFDRPITRFRVSPDSSTLFLTAEDAGHDKIFSLAAAGGDVKPVSRGNSGVFSNLEVTDKAASPILIANWESMTSPPEVVRVDLATGERSFLSTFNRAACDAIDWQPPKEFWTTTKSGTKVHSFLVLPPAFDESKKYPLVVFMHGGPHQASKDQWSTRWNFNLLASAGYVVMTTNYTGSPGYGEQFAAAINKDVLRGPANEINEAADDAIRKYPFIDAARQAAGGASYGGYLANWMEGNTTRYKCLFSHAGLTDNISMWGATDGGYYWELRYGGPVWESKGQWEDQNPLRYAVNFKTPMLVTHGGNDLRVPLGQGLEMFKLLQRQKVPSRFIYFPDENHWILKGENGKYFYEELFRWLAAYLREPVQQSAVQ